jgi:WXG100 family type VII secretion target
MSTDGRMLVTFAAINEAAMDADSIASQIAQQLSDLKSYLAPLVATWSGQASSDFQALQARWDASAEDLNQVLRQMSQALRSAGEQYQATESANTSIWS